MGAPEGSDDEGRRARLGRASALPSGSGERPPADLLDARLCARVGCGGAAEHTLTADYSERVMAVGPLSPVRMPPALDLCDRHGEALSPPEGWTLFRHDPKRT